jgi:hypothetical protein
LASTGGPGRIVRTIGANLDKPEEIFLFPKLFRIKSWYRRNDITTLELRLDFRQGIYILGELSFDDSDLGVFNIDYIDRLVELDRNRKSIEWSKPAALIERKELLPVPDQMIEHLERAGETFDVDYRAMVESFLAFLEEQKSLTLFTNNSYGLTSLLGESEEEFRRLCYSYANAEKSERALELAGVYERKIEQAVRSVKSVDPPALDAKEEIALARVESFRLACKSLLNKAINLHFLEQPEYRGGGVQVKSYVDPLRAEAEAVATGLESRVDEYMRFASELIKEMEDLEQEFVARAETITSVEAPMSRYSIQVLRVARAWLPYWRAEYRLSGQDRTILIRAY